MRRFKHLFLALIAPLMIGISMQPALAFDLFGDACKNSPNAAACQQAQNEGDKGNNRLTGPKNIINVAANIMALVTGVAAVIMIVVSGLTMVTSGGNSEAVTASRRRLLAAVIGLVIVALAWTIIRFVTDKIIQ